MTLFDEDLYKTYRQQGKEIYDFDMNNMIIIKDELLAVGYMDGSLRLWDMKMGQYIREVAHSGKLHIIEYVLSWTNVGIEILFKDHNARLFRGTHHQNILNVKKNLFENVAMLFTDKVKSSIYYFIYIISKCASSV